MKPEVARRVGQLTLIVSLFFIVAPVINVSLQAWPMNPGNQSWRFGALGFFLGALTLPTLGFGLMALGGALTDSKATVRAALVLTSLFLLITIAGLADFLIEARSLRAQATQDTMRQLVDLEVGRTRILSLTAIPALAAIAIWSYKLGNAVQSAEQVAVDPLVRVGDAR